MTTTQRPKDTAMITCQPNSPSQTAWFETLSAEHAAEVLAFEAWCEREGIDPNGDMAREEYDMREENPEVATGTLCCWCDATAVHNLDQFFDVCCTVHFIQYYEMARSDWR